ncbi:SDR family NAD(P)-dependent oxidoreductase [Curvibacter sp. CHRR-16]|uniref:SDR family NAD(P)-dependent oxidoreductase n=1 Tax=Curvibacter sp. CHRR-16 TaxID=2835872 RepID=UPI001BDB4EEF|nr:SDR family NAD(P)-dependent oxidoreductase [Curvibacter sp. CHRR-16]MBT0569038.1 SDR family NAD(P)-dependent oxidoreductase [Curvibacter sp. CHRR-16]
MSSTTVSTLPTALVTGASVGFGRAIAIRLVQSGYRVLAAARRLEALEQLRQEYGDNIVPVQLDVTSTESLEAIQPLLPSVQLLVNNAGLALGLEKAPQANLDDWETMIQTNIVGLTRLTRAVLPHMVERGQGHVINLSSIAGKYPYPGGNVYGATKAYVTQFSLNLRADLSGTGVRVTDIQPGLCSGTEFSNVRFKGDDAKAAAVYEGVQALTAEDVAEAVHWAHRLPPHVNINVIELMPVAQSFAGLSVARNT